jgi:hypothetical protein
MTQTASAIVAILLAFSGVLSAAETFPIFSTNATWRLFKGRAEASTPNITTWRSNTFNDVSFVDAAAPFTYGEGYAYGTDMTDMLNSYTCFFLRRTFEVTNKAQIAALEMVAKIDDGFVVWINGAEQRRVNMAGVTGDPVTTNTLSTGAPSEPVPYVSYTFASATNYLVNGTNVIAVQVFNTTIGSTDIVFDSLLNAILLETNPPTIVNVTPAPGSVLDNLTQITVQFSEPVAGVNADDLNVHGIGATGISGGPTTYTFTFPPAPYGDVPVIWTSGHGIADLATPPNSFNETQPGATWNYTLVDNVPPIVTNLFPASNALVRILGQIEVTFNETVVGVNAADLLINGQPATNVIALIGSAYIFQFPQQPNGPVTVQWAGGHGIADTAPTPIPFGGGSWNYTVEPNANVTGLVINEINVSNENGLRDEDAKAEDWIEIYNGGTNSVNLAGWSLSDEADEPGQWVFPTKVLLPGQYLVVFASGKDRRAPTGTNRFHTNFKLSGDGEFLGLFTPDSPRQLASGFSPKFPFQRTDYSYGKELGDNLRYFATPTPGASNGLSTINGVVEEVHFSTSRGHFTQPFNLALSCPTRSSFIRYTTNGTDPTLVNGLLYSGPLPVNNTLLIRAAAFATNKVPSTIDSHSFFFNQSAAIRSLPIMSIQTAENNMTGTNGIIGMQGGTGPPANPWVATQPTDYYNPTKTGVAWERPMSVEYIRPDNSGFQIDSGMRVQGSDYTRPRYTPTSKFSYRLYFRGDYGESKLEYPLFADSVVQNFEQIVLRAGHNDISNPFLRDELVRQLHTDMGQVACHGTWVNFFINGVYKGYYNPTERVEEGFLQNWHGGGESWDILTVGSAVQGGDNVFWNAMRSYISGQDVTQPTVFTEIMNRLDVVNFIDYLIVNVYGASWDWPHNNWRAARERVAGGKFRFYVWDAEGAFGLTGRAASNFDSFSTTDSGLLTATAEIPTLYQRLRNSAEFRLLWADRVHKHFYNNGAMTDTNIASRFIQMRAELIGVIPAIDNSILNTWIPQRRAPLLTQFELYGLLASTNAPVFNQHGSNVPPAFSLTMTSSLGGTIYYTTNGDDPRVMFSGAVVGSAAPYTGPVILNQSTLVKARTFNGTWSALTEANFAVASRGVPLRITELNYNPSGSTAYEFIELQNMGSTPVNLGGMYFEGVTYTFPNFASLAAGARLVLASDFNPSAFALRYPGVTVAGYFSANLNNGGERIALKDPLGNVITSVDYHDAGGWPVAADGGGYSLENINPLGDPDDPANWRASASLGGTPGAAFTPPAPGSVRLNEVLAANLGAVNHEGTFPDFVELANSSGAPISLAGWSLTDDGNARKFVFPPGTTIDANGHFVIWCDSLATVTSGLHSGFFLGINGSSVFLYDANTNLADAFTYGLQLADYSVGRVGSAWVLTTPTTNAANVAAAVSPASSISINEFLANPLSGQPDWLELFNNSALPVGLRGTFLSNTSAVHKITSLSFIKPFGFVQLFADEGVGPHHLDFKMDAGGGSIVFYDTAGAEVNRINYGAQTENITRGRLPDGSVTIVNFPGTASPGASNYVASYSGPVLNEVLARNISAVTNAGLVADYVELFNGSGTPFDLSGMSLSVDSLTAGEWIFPPGASIGGNSYVVIWCDDSRAASTNAGNYNTGRALNGESGGVYLFNPLGQLVNSVEYGFQVENRSIGLSAGQWRLMASATPGAVNGSVATLGVNTALRVNEWMANPAGGADWFELFNGTNQPVDLAGLILTDDLTANGTNQLRAPPLSFIGAGGFVKWVADADTDQGRNHVSFSLDADADAIRIYASNGSTIIDTVAFAAQTFGVSQGRLGDGANNIVGFPGSPSPGESNYRLITDVVINEILTYPISPLEDAIELHNPTSSDVPVGGWFLSDSAAMVKKFRIPNSTTIPAGGFAQFLESQFNTGGTNAFTLDRARGGELWLSGADFATNLTGFRTRAKFGASAEGVSFGRHAAGGGIDFVAQSSLTLGTTNSGPLVGPIVINEIMYNPINGLAGATEFIELRNISGDAVALFDPLRPTNAWRLANAVSFSFPSVTNIGVGGYLLVVDFDPTNSLALANFRARYNVSPSVPVFGPYAGKLDSGGERVELLKPDLPVGAFVPYVLVDQVEYGSSAPWPSGNVNGGGLTLQRRVASDYGNDPANWLAAAPTAGSANFPGGTPPVITQSPPNTNVLLNGTLLLQAAATGSGPISWQWRFNGAQLPGETNASLFIDYLRNEDAGTYDVYALNSGGVAFSSAAQVLIAESPYIISAPPAVYGTNGGSNVTFTVAAGGSAPLSYQWKRDGVDIPGATVPTLVLTNLVLTDSAYYTLTVSNIYGVANATTLLQVLIRPAVTNHIISQTVLQGANATFTLTAGPNHPLVPLGFRWIRNGGSLPGITTSVPVLVISNVQASGTIRVAVTNAALPSSGTGAFSPGPAAGNNVQLTMLADVDGDGMWDSWETNYFGTVNTTNTSANALQDPDGDGMSNRDEYIAGTNPTNALSLLNIVLTATNANVLQFVAQTNVSYSVQWRTNLSAIPWNTLTNITAVSQVRTIQVNSAAAPASDQQYFRVVTPIVP